MLKELVAISNRYGANPELVLAGGGNTSFKDEKNLWIKGSGTTLATITDIEFVKMNRAALAAMFATEYPKEAKAREAAVLADLMAAREKGEENKRPSVETLLHDLFNFKFVVHTHPALVNGLTCAIDGPEECQKLFGDRAVWIELTPPGYVLSVAIRDKMIEFKEQTGKDADIILLQNHGIFVAGNSSEEIDEKYEYVLAQIKEKTIETPDFSKVKIDDERVKLLATEIQKMNGGGEIEFTTNVKVLEMLANQDTFAPLSSVYTPDHMVYYKRAPLFVLASDDIDKQYSLLNLANKEFMAKYDFKPQIVAVQGLGYFSLGDSEKAAKINGILFTDTIKIATYARSFGGPLFMAEQMVDFIANWEVEAYRKKVNEKNK